MKKTLYRLIVLATIMISGCNSTPCAVPTSQQPITLQLWPQLKTNQPTETIMPSKGDNILRITNVKIPTITLYKPSGNNGATTAVMVCPGGGYGMLAYNHEGTEIAQWLNSIGYSAVILKYTVPKNRPVAFKDAQRAMALIRHHAPDWNIDPDRIGVIGFSAGGHLAARLCNNFKTKSYEHIDLADQLSPRPDFAMLIYPAYMVKDNELVEEMPVSSDTPPTFLVHTQNDPITADSSILYYQALKKVKVPSELHIFPTGGHGYGLRPSKHPVSEWPNLCETWLKNLNP